MMKVESYAPHSAKAFAEASKHKRVLFFASSWCPSCRSADKDTTENIKLILADTVIFKTDYIDGRNCWAGATLRHRRGIHCVFHNVYAVSERFRGSAWYFR